MNDIVWRRSDDWVGTEVEDSFVMVSIESGKYVALNRTADAVWRALETPRSEQEICSILMNQFDVASDQCAAEVSSALQTMRDLDLTSPQ